MRVEAKQKGNVPLKMKAKVKVEQKNTVMFTRK